MIAYIDAHKERFGVEPICEQLPIAPSTCYAAKSRPPSARAVRDDGLKPEIQRVYRDNFGVYGARADITNVATSNRSVTSRQPNTKCATGRSPAGRIQSDSQN